MLLGYDPWDIGLQVHQVSVEPLLDKIGIPYNPEYKYSLEDKKVLEKPKHPEIL